MKTTSKGYKKPELNDKDFYDQIEYDIDRLDAHSHNGVDSARLSPGATTPYSQAILTAAWIGASAPYYFDVIFPIGWDMVWADNTPCPVQVVVRDAAENQVFLDQGRATGGLGVRVYTYIKADLIVGLY